MFCKQKKWKELLKKITPDQVKFSDVAINITKIITSVATANWGLKIPNKIQISEETIKQAAKAIDVTIDLLRITQLCGNLTGEQKIKCFVTELKKMTPVVQEALKFKMSSLILASLDNWVLSQKDYDTITQTNFKFNHND